MNESPASPLTPKPAAPVPERISLRLPSALPRVMYAILGLTIAMYVLQFIFPQIIYMGDKNNSLIRAGQLWRLITPILLHGPIWHIGFNMYALFSLGSGLERRFGHVRFLLLYLLAGFAGNVLSFLVTDANSIGASTSIFGLIAAEGVFLYQNRRLFGEEARQAIGNVVSVAAINLFIGFSSGGYIDNWGHIGGLLGGLIFTWFGGPLWEVEGMYPLLRLVDRRGNADLLLGAGMVLLLFGGLAVIGLIAPILR
ncbi:MAG: rhomboid family intramembrane serine protease [Chloroflexota bacterium]